MDVLLTNDDVTLAEPMIDGLRNLSKTLPNVGVIAPTVIGGVGTIQQHAGRVKGEAFRSYRHLCFVCVYIPRKALNLVGPMDEQFHGYGGDDVDYCWRIRQAGLFLYIAPEFRVRHGHGDRSYSSSFLRVMDEQNRMCEMRAMDDILKRKWNGLARSIA
jgi:GT2 family glycosyltransferase